MTGLSPAEIAEARSQPRAGDVWRKDGMRRETRTVLALTTKGLSDAVLCVQRFDYARAATTSVEARFYRSRFDRWTADATLVKRGLE